MNGLKQKMKISKFKTDLLLFIEENREFLQDEDIDLLLSVCNLVWIKFRELKEEEKVRLVYESLSGKVNIHIENSIKFLIENELIQQPEMWNVSKYYFRKYVLKKKMLI